MPSAAVFAPAKASQPYLNARDALDEMVMNTAVWWCRDKEAYVVGGFPSPEQAQEQADWAAKQGTVDGTDAPYEPNPEWAYTLIRTYSDPHWKGDVLIKALDSRPRTKGDPNYGQPRKPPPPPAPPVSECVCGANGEHLQREQQLRLDLDAAIARADRQSGSWCRCENSMRVTRLHTAHAACLLCRVTAGTTANACTQHTNV